MQTEMASAVNQLITTIFGDLQIFFKYNFDAFKFNRKNYFWLMASILLIFSENVLRFWC